MSGESRERPFDEPTTIPELAQNGIAELFNQALAGEISWLEAKSRMDALEGTRAEVGDGWFDRYGGAPPAELDDLFEGEERYWERDEKPA